MVWLCSTVVANALRALANGFNQDFEPVQPCPCNGQQGTRTTSELNEFGLVAQHPRGKSIAKTTYTPKMVWLYSTVVANALTALANGFNQDFEPVSCNGQQGTRTASELNEFGLVAQHPRGKSIAKTTYTPKMVWLYSTVVANALTALANGFNQDFEPVSCNGQQGTRTASELNEFGLAAQHRRGKSIAKTTYITKNGPVEQTEATKEDFGRVVQELYYGDNLLVFTTIMPRNRTPQPLIFHYKLLLTVFFSE